MIKMGMVLLFTLLLWGGFGSQPVNACTSGVDCRCDHVRNPADPLYDPNLLLCEDWDAPGYRDFTSSGGGAPNYGSWWDDTGNPTDRGHNALWVHKYGTPITGMNFLANQPASPLNGPICGSGFSFGCSAPKVYDPSDRDTANALNPGLMFPSQASDFTAEVGSLTIPTNTSSGVAGIFEGNSSLTHRLGVGSVNGISGESDWGRAVFHIGCTFAVALSSNFITNGPGTGAGDNNQKFNEFIEVDNNSSGFDGLCGFGLSGTGTTLYAQYPFYGFIGGGASGVNCSVVMPNVVNTHGTSACDGNYFTWHGDPAVYTVQTDWPLATWACIQADIDFSTQSSGRIRQYITTLTKSQTLVVDISGIGGTGLTGALHGWNGHKWNDYANANQGLGGVPTTATVFRYEDNFQVTNGPPVSCAAIGFTGALPPPPPVPFVDSYGRRWIVRVAEVLLPVLGIGWHFRRQIIAVSLASITFVGTSSLYLVQNGRQTYENAKIASKYTTLKLLTYFNKFTEPK